MDVNVHPTKMDVRFTNAMGFSAFLCGAVKYTLKHHEMIPEALLSTERERKNAEKEERVQREREKTPEPFEQRRSGAYRVAEEMRYEAERPKMQEFIQNPVWARVKGTEKPINAAETAGNAEKLSRKPDTPDEQENLEQPKNSEDVEDFFTETSELEETTEKFQVAEDTPYNVSEQEDNTSNIVENTSQLNLFEEKLLKEENRSAFRIIGQVFETYWLIEFENKLLMIDQHAAHEKVNYERLMKQFHEKNVVSQVLMPPVIVSLTGQEETVLNENIEVFSGLGFEIEGFGGSEYALRSVPVDLYGCDEREMFLEVLDQLAEGRNLGGIRVVEEKIASMSCKAAVKGNNLLSPAEAEALIDELLTLENPYNCPHGRPTIVTMTKSEMDKKFKRIVN